jgi:hypothetical protein
MKLVTNGVLAMVFYLGRHPGASTPGLASQDAKAIESPPATTLMWICLI